MKYLRWGLAALFLVYATRKFIGHPTPWETHRVWGIPPAGTWAFAIFEALAAIGLVWGGRASRISATSLALLTVAAGAFYLAHGDLMRAIGALPLAVALAVSAKR